MHTSGLSDPAARDENRLKQLFWPTIRTAHDVDYLGAAGYWICTVVALFAVVGLLGQSHPFLAVLLFLFFYLGGVGVRERTRYAAAAVFLAYVADMLGSGPGVLRVFLAALLLSNLRATWIASRWKPDSEDAVPPPRLNETLTDKIADQLPMWLWPKVRVFYYALSVIVMVLLVAGDIALFFHWH